MEFNIPSFDTAAKLAGIYSLRDNKTCDSTVLDTYIWKGYYNTRIYVEEDRAALLLMHDGENYFSAMPYCRQEDLQEYFDKLRDYFNNELKKPLVIYLADEDAINALKLWDNPDQTIKEQEDLKDYIYSAEQLRTLAGKKFQKKRNLVNKFMKEYEGRWEYATMCCKDEYFLEIFMKDWVKERLKEGTEKEEDLIKEKEGVLDILRNCDKVTFRVGGIFIDEKLEAFTIGSYNKREKMVVVSVEKANSEFTGIYQAINQLFLQNSYPDAEFVNREDDMGLEGLRQAKESYNPVGYARKYLITQKNFAG